MFAVWYVVGGVLERRLAGEELRVVDGQQLAEAAQRCPHVLCILDLD